MGEGASSSFVLEPMAEALFRTADIPHRLMPAALALATSTFTMSAHPGTPAIQNAIPKTVFRHHAFCSPGLGMIALAIRLGVGLWWLKRAQAPARRKEGLRTWGGHRKPMPPRMPRKMKSFANVLRSISSHFLSRPDRERVRLMKSMNARSFGCVWLRLGK